MPGTVSDSYPGPKDGPAPCEQCGLRPVEVSVVLPDKDGRAGFSVKHRRLQVCNECYRQIKEGKAKPEEVK